MNGHADDCRLHNRGWLCNRPTWEHTVIDFPPRTRKAGAIFTDKETGR